MLISRDFANAKSVTDPPGQPDGAYLVLQYRSSFERKRKSIETHTLVLESGSEQWRTAGYFIR